MTGLEDHSHQLLIGLGLLVAGAGVFHGHPALVLSAAVPLGYIAYGSLTPASPVTDQLRVTRSISPTTGIPGEQVTVTVTVENISDQVIADLRVIDGVPAELAVVDGSSRGGTTLQAGEDLTLTYTMRLRHGTFQFEPVEVRTRSVSAMSVYTAEIPPTGDRTVESSLDPRRWAASTQGGTGANQQGTDRGEGVAFHTVREYQPGDPVTHIDWRRYAKDEVLLTREFAAGDTTDWILIADVRARNAIAPERTAATGVERAIQGTLSAYNHFQQHDHSVGAIVLGGSAATPRVRAVSPGTSRETAARLRMALTDAMETAESTAAETESIETAIARLDRATSNRPRVLVLSPVLDRYPVELTQQLTAQAWNTTVLVPAVIGTGSPEQTVLRAARESYTATIEEAGAGVIEWPADTPPSHILQEIDR